MPHTKCLMLAAFYLCVAPALPVAAQTPIDVPSDTRWQHARSQLILPTNIGDMQRQSITDYSPSELNVAAQFSSNTEEATIYVFRPYWPDIGAWFDRSEVVLLSNKSAQSPEPEPSPARTFARPKGMIESGMRRNYTFGKGRYKSSSLALVPYGGWLLKIRYSSENADPSATDAMVDKILSKVGFPIEASEGPPVRAIAACTEIVKWKKAKVIREDMVSAMITGAMLPALLESDATAPPTSDEVCKLPTTSEKFSLYRETSGKTKFWMLVMDAGATAQIMETSTELTSKQYSSVVSMDTVHNFLPGFNRMPDPEQWFSLIVSGASRATVRIDPEATEGTEPEITINIAT